MSQTIETSAQLVARRPQRLNILISKTFDGVNCDGKAVAGNAVSVRYGWSILDQEQHDRPVCVHVPGSTTFDPEAINNIGQLGACVVRSDIAGIERVVAALREAWGNLHVQDNSGRCGHLHQGMFQG